MEKGVFVKAIVIVLTGNPRSHHIQAKLLRVPVCVSTVSQLNVLVMQTVAATQHLTVVLT
jgi:hypothetical protein